MNNKLKIILSILGAFSVLIDLLTPIAVALFLGFFLNVNNFTASCLLIIGCLATLFRGITIGWLK